MTDKVPNSIIIFVSSVANAFKISLNENIGISIIFSVKQILQDLGGNVIE